MIFKIHPNTGVASFNIGEEIDTYTDKHAYSFHQGKDDVSWDEYDFYGGQLEVYVDKKERTVESICCRKNCYLDDINLIGLSYDEFLQRFGLKEKEIQHEEIWMSNTEKQSVYEIEDLSLQLWVDHDNVIKTVFLG
jgi:hypothetical protein